MWNPRYRLASLASHWPTRGFLAGLALTTPFISNPLFNEIALLFVVPLLIDLFARGIRFRAAFQITPILAIIYVLAALHLIAIYTTPFWTGVLSGVVWASGATGIFLLASDDRDSPNDILKGLFVGLIATAAIVSVAGLIKYMLQLNGYVFGAMINSCFGRYPQGTTFCGDYNLFALYMVIAAIGLSVYILSSDHTTLRRWTFLLSLAAILAAGFFAGSRRYMFVVPLVPVLWVAFAVWKRPAVEVARLSLLPIIATSALYMTFSYPFPRVDADKMIVIEAALSEWINPGPAESRSERLRPPEDDLAAREVSPRVLASTMGVDENFGFDTRVERWQLGWTMVKEDGYLFGRGFSYHRQFACHFVECEFADYPHAPIMSSWIAFGIVGFLLVLSFYGLTGVNIFISGKEGILSGVTPVVLAVMPYSLISGDTIFSLPQTIIAALLVERIARRVRYET